MGDLCELFLIDVKTFLLCDGDKLQCRSEWQQSAPGRWARCLICLENKIILLIEHILFSCKNLPSRFDLSLSEIGSTIGTDWLIIVPLGIVKQPQWRHWRYWSSLMKPLRGLAQPSLRTWIHCKSRPLMSTEGKLLAVAQALAIFSGWMKSSSTLDDGFPLNLVRVFWGMTS